MRKGIHLTIGILSGILFTQNIWAQTLKEPVIESQAAVVMDMDSGRYGQDRSSRFFQ